MKRKLIFTTFVMFLLLLSTVYAFSFSDFWDDLKSIFGFKEKLIIFEWSSSPIDWNPQEPIEVQIHGDSKVCRNNPQAPYSESRITSIYKINNWNYSLIWKDMTTNINIGLPYGDDVYDCPFTIISDNEAKIVCNYRLNCCDGTIWSGFCTTTAIRRYKITADFELSPTTTTTTSTSTTTTTMATTTTTNPVCIQVITRACNPLSKEIREFPTPCDVPTEWTTDLLLCESVTTTTSTTTSTTIPDTTTTTIPECQQTSDCPDKFCPDGRPQAKICSDNRCIYSPNCAGTTTTLIGTCLDTEKMCGGACPPCPIERECSLVKLDNCFLNFWDTILSWFKKPM